MNRPMRFYILIALIAAGLGSMATRCKADDTHQVYVGTHWTHLSNVDAGNGYNDKHEDRAEHIGVDVEYQYHMDDQYFFASAGIGKSLIKTKEQEGWDCSGCKFPSSLRVGYKWKIN